MNENEILEEIHRVRAAHAAECGYDVNVMFARMDAELERLKAEGWQIVSPAPREMETACVLREEPPKQK
jgi:hypothetical protein